MELLSVKSKSLRFLSEEFSLLYFGSVIIVVSKVYLKTFNQRFYIESIIGVISCLCHKIHFKQQ